MKKGNLILCNCCSKKLAKDDSHLIEGACYFALCFDCGLKQATTERNKLNREISQIKKQTLEKQKPKCKDCGRDLTDLRYIKMGYCDECLENDDREYQQALKPFKVLKDCEHDKKGDIVNLTPNTATTEKLIRRGIVKPLKKQNQN